MKYQKVSTITQMLVVIAILSFPTAWLINGYKLTQCDFESDYKCEIIHGIGLFGPLAVFTVWTNTDETD